MKRFIEGEGDHFKFRFNPPQGLSYLVITRSEKETIKGGSGNQIDAGESTCLIELEKSKSGYLMYQTSQSLTLSRDGKEFEDPILNALLNNRITYELDLNGKMLDVKGYDRIIDEVKKSAPEEIFSRLSVIFNEEVIKLRDMADWKGRIETFIDLDINIGDIWTLENPFKLPNAEILKVYSAYSFMEKVNIKGVDCIRIKGAYSSNPKELNEAIGTEIRWAFGKKDVPDESHESSIYGETNMLMAPDTMLVYDESLMRKVRMKIFISGEIGIIVEQIEKKNMNFDYGGK